MKKIIAFAITLIVALSLFGISSFADDATSTAVGSSAATVTFPETEATNPSDLYTAANRAGIDVIDSWEKYGYPDDIGAAVYTVSSTGYNPNDPNSSPVMTETIKYFVYVVKGASDERKNELVNLMGGENVEIRECTMSKAKQNEYVLKMGDILGEYTYLIMPTADQNDLRITLYYPEENNDIIVDTVKSQFSEIEDIVELRSGVNPGDLDGNPENNIETVGAIVTGTNNTNAIFFVLIPATVAVLALAISAIAYAKAHSKRVALSNGETAETSSSPTKKEVEQKVKDAALSPSDSVYDEIIKKM